MLLSMTTRKAPAKVRGVYEREPGSGIWWICYKQGSVRKREKVGRRADAVALYQQKKQNSEPGRSSYRICDTMGLSSVS